MLRIEGIVGIARRRAAKQRAGIADGRQRPAVQKPLRQVGIGNKRPAESHEVGETGVKNALRLLLIVIPGHDQRAAEGRAQRVAEASGNGWGIDVYKRQWICRLRRERGRSSAMVVRAYSAIIVLLLILTW